MKKSLFVCFWVAVLAVCLCVAGFASGEQDFSSLVAAIDKNGSYAERLDAVIRAEELYGSLSEEERAAVSEDYSILESERAELSAIAEKADAFILGVGALGDVYDLDEREEQLNILLSEDVYFSDESYPGMKDALSNFETLKTSILARVDASVAFMNAVDRASLLSEDDYAGIKALLSEAEESRALIDYTYDGVSGAVNVYNSLVELFYDKEVYTRDFLQYVKLMNEATTYKAKKQYYTQAMNQTRNEDFLIDYEGVDEAMDSLSLAETYFESCIITANAFITAVGNMSKYENAADGIIAAYAALSGVDKTVDGVSVALKTLEAAKESYNASVKAVKEAFSIL